MTIDRILVRERRGPKSGQKLLSYVTVSFVRTKKRCDQMSDFGTLLIEPRGVDFALHGKCQIHRIANGV
uniref:AlNc14C84G5427 protein n=1 Tax=Albugo laibachii Nc14 TaxID=890382 RepID=F0WFP3_9STRA|nr:AlNc14C84G5427 [Albugo laibachii Nc14]|eukprot:CCA20025.1 AlNc14C84G5427 [Albugo laibachii Nc14]